MPQLPLDVPAAAAAAGAEAMPAAPPGLWGRAPRATRPDAWQARAEAVPSGAVLGLRELCHDLQQEVTLLQHLVERLVDGRAPQPVERALRAQVGVLNETLREAQGPAAPRSVPLRPVVADAVQTAQLVHGGVIELDAPTDGLVQGVTSELRRAFVNLLDNAITAAPAGRILVSVREDDEEVAVDVEDDGSGSSGIAGAGVGMAVVGEVARRHGGSVSLTRGTMGGLAVTLHLPRAEASA